MKKNLYTLSAALLLTASSFAQTFEHTEYRGAFGAAGSANWTDTWAEWDPENVEYAATNKTVDADITTSTTWSTGDIILLKNKVYVTGGATLTIQPGVIIRGDKTTEGSLIISMGSKIIAEGTAANPIVFTTNYTVADGRAPGDWGGLIILGRGIVNQGTSVVEGGLDAAKASYGGSDNTDNSGILSYVRIEFAGYPFQPDKEINGLTLGGVGSGTKIDHIQVSFSNDDGFEWFGGAVTCKHLISYRNVDDDFDTDFGYSGKVQFGLIVRDPDLSDQCSCSSSEGFESDNDGNGSAKTPVTNAIFSNITNVGPLRGGTVTLPGNQKFKRAARIRRNSAISIYNSIFVDWATGLYFDGSATLDNVTGDSLRIKGLVIAGCTSDTGIASGTAFNFASYFTGKNISQYTASSSVGFVNAYPDFANATNLTPDYRLNSGSSALSGALWDYDKMGAIENGVKEVKGIQQLSLIPNPATYTSNLTFSLDKTEPVSIEVLDLTGKTVIVIAKNTVMQAGNHAVEISVDALSIGLYMVNIQSATNAQTLKLSVVK